VSSRRLSELERATATAGRERDQRVDAKQRRAHGVVHTPAELARFVVEAVDAELTELGLPEGLASPRVTIVDPACGPGAFVAASLACVAGRGTRPAAIVGLDRDPAALAQARALLPRDGSIVLRAGDTLATLPEETIDVAVVIGNPPWAGRSESRTPLLDVLLEDFRKDAEGQPLQERKIGVLSDAYVRFVRWSAELVRAAPGGGVLGLVTNASFLDGPVHRGMRAALAGWHRRVRVIDLGGSALVARASGERDENVFGVRPSVAVTIASRGADHERERLERERLERLARGRLEPKRDGREPARDVVTWKSRVEVATLRGTREEKLAALGGSLRFEPVDALGVWRSSRGGARVWPAGWHPLDALVPFHREGIQTNRDALVIDRDPDALVARVQSFALGLEDPRVTIGAREHFDPERARRAVIEALRADPEGASWLVPIAYRPFDRRWLAALPALCHRPRPDLLAAVARSELSLVTVRKDRGTRAWNHVAIVDVAVDNCFLSSRSSCRSRAFSTHGPDGAENLTPLGRELAGSFGARGLLLHAATWLVARAYRERFADRLSQELPWVPPPTAQSVAIGERLARAFLTSGERDVGGTDEGIESVGHWDVRVPHALRAARAEADAWVDAQLAVLG
jgi:hypothetical protein